MTFDHLKLFFGPEGSAEAVFLTCFVIREECSKAAWGSRLLATKLAVEGIGLRRNKDLLAEVVCYRRGRV